MFMNSNAIHLQRWALSIALFLFLIFWSNLSLGQTLSTDTVETQVSEYVQVQLVNGQEIRGRVIEKNDEFIRVESLELGIMLIRKIDMISMEVSNQPFVVAPKRYNPQSSRYFFAPSGIQLQAGEGYYQNGYLIYNQVSYGVTDQLTLGVPFVPFLGLGGSAKLGATFSGDVQNGGVFGSMGGIVVVPFNGLIDEPLGIGFGNVTFGREMSNLTLGAGSAFPSNNPNLILNVSFMTNMNERTWLMSENYLITSAGDNAGLFSLGIRRASENKDSLFDYAMVMLMVDDVTIPIPWISWTVAFN